MRPFVLGFRDIDKAKHALVGGKGANLGELFKLEGIRVPDGFCVSTEAYRKTVGESPSFNGLLDQLSRLKVEDRDQIRQLSLSIRTVVEGIAIPEEIGREIGRHLAKYEETSAFAVRSSATAEDLPMASFAGQQDTFLNIIGKEAILKHVSKCWASLFTERAVIYRLQNGFDHRKVNIAVLIQLMVFPRVAGIMFTADPATSNRKVLSIDASFGLGEGLVSGLVNADTYRVRDGRIVEKTISTKQLAVYPVDGGGTKAREIEHEWQNKQVLTEEEVLRLERIGRMIEAHFDCPQDVEWCLAGDGFYIVQSRPITTLFPIPETGDHEYHVYLSVGHQQMMTDPIRPLGLSFFLLTTRAPMRTAGGRLFVDVTPILASPDSRQKWLETMGGHDPLIKDALTTIVERGDFVRTSPGDMNLASPHKDTSRSLFPEYPSQVDNDPAVVSDLIKRSQTSIEALKRDILAKSGSDLFDFILDDIQQLRALLFDPRSTAVWMAAMDASTWINNKMEEWLGVKNAADTLSQSVPNNITSEMGLALLDVADVIRPYPEVIAFLKNASDDTSLEDLSGFEGGQTTQDAIRAYLDKYGMRCVGEIDITRTRWSEKPTTLFPLILSNLKNFEPGAGKRKFEQGRQEALKAEHDYLQRLRRLPGGKQKSEQAKRMISLIRNFMGYREYPKYGMISRYFVYKQALLKEAEQLVRANVIRHKEDIYYLTFEELREVVRTGDLDHDIIGKRKQEYRFYEKLTPPRVITSDGEIVAGEYKREDVPPGALVGLPVSSGVVEGRARVILRMEDAELEKGDILVTPFTDPSWTPLFVSVLGLVTEVGGLMTHGAVIAREYGLPAVVGVENATKLINDGQRIRVHGTEGYVEIL